MTISGAVGSILWGYRVAARVTQFSLTRGQGGTWALRCVVQERDTFAMSQGPLKFSGPYSGGQWVGSIVGEVEIVNGWLSARLDSVAAVPEGNP